MNRSEHAKHETS